MAKFHPRIVDRSRGIPKGPNNPICSTPTVTWNWSKRRCSR